MLSLLKLSLYSIGLIYNSTYDVINGTFYPNHTDYITYTEQNNKTYNFNNYLIYKENLDYIDDMNSKNLSYDLEINWLIDYKIQNRMEIYKRNECHNCHTFTNDIVPESIDWRKKNAVTHVKNQGNCGSCWSFSSTGSIEGAWSIKNNNLYNLSEQMLMDCSNLYGNNGCQGGLMDNAFKYVIDNDGLCTEDEYPYKEKEGICKSRLCRKVVQISDYSDVTPNDEKILKRAVAQQPISVAIQANLSSFHFYKSGIYQDDDCGTGLDHGVLIVGYGTDKVKGLDYWIVKNSWSPQWGENGYVRILRNYDKSDSGMCGIAVQPSFPIV
jgi:C1A family cysteine protease